MVDFSNLVTAVVTTSPIPSHPDTSIIAATYESIRFHFVDIPVLILADGVRIEQKCWTERYENYKRQLHDRGWVNCRILEFQEFKHQAGMIRDAISMIYTPLILWVEHDLPLLKKPIQWDGIVQALLARDVCSVRFPMDDVKKPYYERGTIESHGVSLTKTVEFSSLPNIARKDLYEFIIPHFQEAKIHFECNKICGLFHEDDCKQWPLSMYNSPDGQYRAGSLAGRSAGLNRPDGPKLPMRF
jgi:hypothetical protein